MNIIVSAANANRKFSELLRGVREGKTYTVTSHGRPVAKIISMDLATPAEDRSGAFRHFLGELAKRPALNLPRITRDEMNERD